MSGIDTFNTSRFAHLCGWVPPEYRNKDQQEADKVARSDFLPRLPAELTSAEMPNKRFLTEIWKNEQVVTALGRPFGGFWQKRGSCVGAGGGTMLASLIMAEVVIDGDREEITWPFWLLPYAVSRQLAGIRGKGDGSLGSTFAAACKKGFVKCGLDGLPALREDGGGFMTFGAQAEYDWSDASKINQSWFDKASEVFVGDTVVVKKGEVAKASLASWHPMTIAYERYCSPDRARPAGGSGMVVGQFDTYGPHQTSIQAYVIDPDLGLMFWNQNQWGPVYQQDPLTGLKSGCWVSASELERAASQDELIAFSGLKGFISRSGSHDY